MAIKKLFASLGVGGASVETVLTEPNVLPGGVLQGEILVVGGTVTQSVQALSVGLRARAEAQRPGEKREEITFHTQELGGALELTPAAQLAVPFSLGVPWETPLTSLLGQRLTGTTVGMTTQLNIARSLDSTDLEPVMVHPLPAQQAVLDAFVSLEFTLTSAAVEVGTIPGTRQTLPFYQVLEFQAPARYRGLKEVELSFLADERAMDVVLEMDKQPGRFTTHSDAYLCYEVDLARYGRTDWTAHLNQWLAEVGGRRKWS